MRGPVPGTFHLREGESVGVSPPARSLVLGVPCMPGQSVPPFPEVEADAASPVTLPLLEPPARDVSEGDQDREDPSEATDLEAELPPGVTVVNDLARMVARTRLPEPVADEDETCYGGGVSGTGNVTGPASSTDHAVARYDGTTGKVIQNSGLSVADPAGGVIELGANVQADLHIVGVDNGKGDAFDVSMRGGDGAHDGGHAIVAGGDGNFFGNAGGNVVLTPGDGTGGANVGRILAQGAIEVGHDTDTTLARQSAGNLSVEGKLLYRVDGTDVAIADGGTGASSADAAVQNLTNGATSRTPVLTDEIPFNDVGTGGGKTTPQALWDLGTSLTAKTTPADTDTFPLNDPTAKKVTLANLRNAIGAGPAVLVALQSSTQTLSTTMTDTSLSVSLEAGAWYALEAELRLSANNTVAIQCDWDGGTATLTGISYNGYRRTTTVDAIAQTTSRSTDVTLLNTAVTTAGVHLFGYVQVNAAGTFILRMRRASASGTHQLVAGSWVKFTKIS